MFPCSVFPPVALLHHLIYNTDSEPLACPRNVSFSYLYSWSNFWFLTNLRGFASVLQLLAEKCQESTKMCCGFKKWTRHCFGPVSRTLDFSKLKSHLKSWSSPKPFPSCQKPLFQSESKCEAIDMKIVFNSHSNKMLVFMSSFKRGASLRRI